MGWKIVTDEAGRQFYEGDLQLAVAACPERPGVAERNMFLRVAAPNGVANFPVGPKAPEWLLRSQQRAAAALTDAINTLGLGSIKSAPGTGPGSPEVVQSVKPETPPTDSSAWNMDAVRALTTWPNPFLPEIKSELPPRGYVGDPADYDEAYEVVNGAGEVVRRDPVDDGRSAVADPTTDTNKWTLPDAGMQPWQTDLVQKLFGGVPIVANPNVRPGEAFLFNPAYMAGSGWVSDSTAQARTRWINDPSVAPPTPAPEPPEGRFQNLDWD